MNMIEFEHIGHSRPRAAAVIGDTLASIIGKPTSNVPSLVFNVTDQPASSNIFNGLGTAGADVPFTDLGSATFTHAGFHVFTVTAGNAQPARLEILCWPSQTLDHERVKYDSLINFRANSARPTQQRRGVLRSLAVHATQAGAEAALEGGAAVAPFYGLRPDTLGASSTNSLAPFGGW